VKSYPAVDIHSMETDLLYALVDDFSPTALEEREDGIRAFFASESSRDAALRALCLRFDAAAIDVPDDDWASRSQSTLGPVVVGGVKIVPPWSAPGPPSSDVVIVIEPSMGFGTGHHASTRLCLAALQDLELKDKTVLDVGTGSGVLAITAARLGAVRVYGLDVDPDAIQSARRNLALNPLNPEAAGGPAAVSFHLADVLSTRLPGADIVTANLTGALLMRSAPVLLSAVRAGGSLVVGGMLAHERDEVLSAFPTARVWRERTEDEWICLVVERIGDANLTE
jgi:ribosomal protein L11 methyltransferase